MWQTGQDVGGQGAGGEEQQVVRAAGQIGGLTLLSRISGLGRDVVIGQVFGTG